MDGYTTSAIISVVNSEIIDLRVQCTASISVLRVVDAFLLLLLFTFCCCYCYFFS